MPKEKYKYKRPKKIACPNCQSKIRVSQGWGDAFFFVIFFSVAGIVTLFLKKSIGLEDAHIYMIIFISISLVMCIATIFKIAKPSVKSSLKENCSSCDSVIQIEYKQGNDGASEWITSIFGKHNGKTIERELPIRQSFLNSNFHKSMSKSFFYIVLVLVIINGIYLIFGGKSGWALMVVLFGGIYLVEEIVRFLKL